MSAEIEARIERCRDAAREHELRVDIFGSEGDEHWFTLSDAATRERRGGGVLNLPRLEGVLGIGDPVANVPANLALLEAPR